VGGGGGGGGGGGLSGQKTVSNTTGDGMKVRSLAKVKLANMRLKKMGRESGSSLRAPNPVFVSKKGIA